MKQIHMSALTTARGASLYRGVLPAQPQLRLELAVGTGEGNDNASFASLMEEGPVWKNHLASSQST